MPDLTVTTPPTLPPGDKGQHYTLIKQAIPTCLINSSPPRRRALKETSPDIPAWYAAASQAQKDQLSTLLDARCVSQNKLEKYFSSIQLLQAFAQPLLEAKLKASGHVLDVNQTWLRLYFPVENAFGAKTGGFKVKTFSLLKAALCNFEAREAEEDFFDSASGFITAPNEQGHFERHTTTLEIHTFAQLCRELDLGDQYQTYLRPMLHHPDGRKPYVRYQIDAFKVAAHLALIKGDIGHSDYALLQRVETGEKRIMLDGKRVRYRRLSLMNLALRECLIIAPCRQPRLPCWVIVYIPDDPDHPIKRYESFEEFSKELTDRLTASASRTADRSNGWTATQYQQFFARFVADADRAYYYRRLTELVVDAPPQPFGEQWLRSEWGRLLTAPSFSTEPSYDEPQPSVRVSATDPEFNIQAYELSGLVTSVDLWVYRYASLRGQMLADARNQAVSTAEADEASRSRRAAHYLSIGLFALNLVGMAVPPLGVVMTAVTAGQLLYEIVEGVTELSQGDREAGWSHITDVLENLALLVVQGAALHFTVSPFIEQLKAVTLPSGKTRLWKPDLSAYEHTSPLPGTATSDERGLHTFNGKTLLLLEGRRYALQKDPVLDRYSITHPTRSDAYQPKLTENGAGLWNHEAESPHSWEGVKLMRRLGLMTEGLSDTQLQQVRHVADVSEDVLRRVHVEGEPVPAILLDTLRQFRAYHDAEQVAQGIRANLLPDALCSYSASLAVEMPRWPKAKAIEAFVATTLEGDSVKYGNQSASRAETLRVSRDDLVNGLLPRRIVEFLDERELEDLIEIYPPKDPQARIDALRDQLENHAKGAKARLMRSIYETQRPKVESPVALIQRDFSSLPGLMAQELLADVPPKQLQKMVDSRRIPLELAENARVMQRRFRLALAYEGLYLEAMAGPDTEALVLNTLPALPGWSDNLRLEIREAGVEGVLRASLGPKNATDRKILVRVGDGRYQAFDGRGQQLHGINGLYGTLQHALPDAHRNRIGLPHVGQGEELKVLVIQHAIPREQLAGSLGMQPARRTSFRPWQTFPDGRRGYPLSGRGGNQWDQITQERVRKLYPHMARDEMLTMIQERGALDLTWLKALEDEYKTMQSTLMRWMTTHKEGVERFGAEDRKVLRARRRIYETLIDAWKRVGPGHLDAHGRYLGQKIEWHEVELGQQLQALPALTANFDHVTYVGLYDVDVTDADIVPFLANFRGLRRLNVEACELTQLPAAIEQMPHLRRLSLGGNHIVLTSEDVLRLKGCVQLRELALSINPLGLSPDVSRMPLLRTLLLNDTGLQEWPTGVFRVPRPADFILDMQSNPLSRVPEFAPGSDKALIVARTFLSRDGLEPDQLARFKSYIEAAGRDPDRRMPARGSLDSDLWKTGYSDEEWPSRQLLWEMLEGAFGSEGFFDVIRAVRNSGDALAPGGRWLPELTAKVWRMLEAMGEDVLLREELFLMARDTTACVDAGAQLFNSMGVVVLLRSAYFSEDVASVRRAVFKLARGKWRLDELGRIAHDRVARLLEQGVKFAEYDEQGQRVQHEDAHGEPIDDIDEVEIYLAYTVPLATRLDLPWQSRTMMFREDYVTPSMVDSAFERVKALDQGEQLRTHLLEQPMWTDFLQRAHHAEYAVFAEKFDALIDYQAAQKKWAGDAGLSESARQALRQTIGQAAQRLGRSGADSEPGRLMSDSEYRDAFDRINAELITLNQRLTDQAISEVA